MTDDPIERQRRHFDGIAHRYGEARQHPNHTVLKSLIWAKALEGTLEGFEGPLKVLEPMCGFADGYTILESHTDREIRYSGFDYSSEVIEAMRSSRPDLDLEVADVSQYRTDETFDVIILLGGLHHVPHVARQVVGSLSRCLKPGGLFINFEPTHGNSIFRWCREFIYSRNELFDEETERAFSVSELTDMFLAAGLEHEKTIWPGLLTYVLYYNPDAFPLLNKGPTGLVEALWKVERPLVSTELAKRLSFATLTIWKAPGS